MSRFSRVMAMVAATVVASAPSAQDLTFRDPQTTLSAFAGQMTNDGWETIVLRSADTEWLDSRLAGVVLGRDWSVLDPRFRVGFEAQMVKHWGMQDHVEFDVPLTLRYRALDPWVPVQGAAFGLGLSWASEAPELEIERKGNSQRWLAHWFAEVEFGRPDWGVHPFLRLHHRSDGYVIADFDTGSNGVVFGLRVPF